MAVVTDLKLYGYFLTGKYPTQQQFADLIDSKMRVDALIPMSQVAGLQDYLNQFSTDIIDQVTVLCANVQLERRIAIPMQGDTQIIPLSPDEPMMIYKCTASNVDTLQIKSADPSNNAWVAIPIDGSTIAIDLTPYLATNAIIQITRTTIDNDASVYLFCKVTQ